MQADPARDAQRRSQTAGKVAAAAGILLFPTFSGTPEEAALAFLGGTVARDPNNKCNACGFQSSCSLSGKGGCGKT